MQYVFSRTYACNKYGPVMAIDVFRGYCTLYLSLDETQARFYFLA